MRRLTLTLTHRADGRFAKRIDGQYFIWPDEETARAELLALINRREAGEDDGISDSPGAVNPPLRDIGNQYRAARQHEVKLETWNDYEEAIDDFFSRVGKHRRASSLAPADFAKVRAAWVKQVGPWRVDNRVQAVRTMFRWAARVARLIPAEPWYGDSFRKTTAAEKRRVRRENAAKHGERIFTAAELALILRRVRGPLKAFTLLGLNGGMYAADIAQLRKSDLKRIGNDWLIDNDREKTGVRRKFVLWPETVKELDKVKDRGESPLLFRTVHGNAWVREGINSIVMLYTDFLKDIGVKRKGLNFGALKHTHVSAVSDQPDLNAARLVRGHRFEGIESHYDYPSLSRIKAITDIARKRLLTSVVRPSPKRSRNSEHGASRRRRGSVSRRA
jgi:integrase